MEAGSGALLDELDAIIPHISGGSASVEDFVAKKKAVAAAHQDNPRNIEASHEAIVLFRFVCTALRCWSGKVTCRRSPHSPPQICSSVEMLLACDCLASYCFKTNGSMASNMCVGYLTGGDLWSDPALRPFVL